LAVDSLSKRIDAQLQSIVVLKEGELSSFYNRSIDTINIISEQDSVHSYLSKVATGLPHQDASKKAVSSLNKILPHSTFSEIHLVDASAQSDTSTQASDSARDWGNEQLFTEGKKAFFVQNFYYDVVFQQPRIAISAPVKNQKNEVTGVIIGIVKMDDISNLMTERSGLGQSGETYLVNKFNSVVSELKKKKEGNIKTSSFIDQGTIYTDNVKDCIKGNQKFTTYKDYAGDTVLGLYKWIPDKEVCLLAQIDSNEAFAPLNWLKLVAIILGLVLVIVTFILGSILARSISSPIIHLRDAALEIGKGNLDARIGIKTTDEIGQLAAAFNQMTIDLKNSKTKLEDYGKSLEKTVAERTEDLNQKIIEMERMNKLMVDRELKMVELKKEIEELKKASG